MYHGNNGGSGLNVIYYQWAAPRVRDALRCEPGQLLPWRHQHLSLRRPRCHWCILQQVKGHLSGHMTRRVLLILLIL